MRTYLIRPIFTIAVLAALVVMPAFAQQGIVRGKVSDEKGAPLRDATVTFEAEESTTKRQVKTDARGDFLLIAMDSAKYKISVAKEGYATDVISVDIKQQGNPPLTFKLVPAGAAPVKSTTVVTEGNAGAVAASALAPAGTDAKAAAALQALARTAIQQLNEGKNDEAIAAFTELVTKVPTCADCYFNLGVGHMNKKELGEAEKAFKQAISIRPEHADAWDRLASIYNSQKKFDLAAEASGNAAKYQAAAPGAAAGGAGGNAASLYNQGVALFNGGKFAEAKTAFESATKADPSMALAHYQLGMTALNLGDFALAVRSLETYLQLEPNGAKAAEVKASLPALKGMVKK
jgi:Tfp pilus assembly protein PilF